MFFLLSFFSHLSSFFLFFLSLFSFLFILSFIFFLFSSFSPSGLEEASVTIDILGENVSYCASDTVYMPMDVLELWCQDIEGQYPLGHALRITTTFLSHPQELSVCNVSVWGQAKIGECVAPARFGSLEGIICVCK